MGGEDMAQKQKAYANDVDRVVDEEVRRIKNL
jgi:hypothetical protein